jgi:hypothetical protein
MTVISENVGDIAGADNSTVFVFASAAVRNSSAGTALITDRAETYTAVGGVLTTGDLDPGLAIVRVGVHKWAIEIPDSPTPIRLQPLLDAATPIPPAQEASAVRNGGGVRRIEVDELADYAAIATPDPETLFFIPE